MANRQSRSVFDAEHRRDVTVAVLAVLLAGAALVAGSDFGQVHNSTPRQKVIVWSAAAALAVFGFGATRRVSNLFNRIVSAKAMPAAGAAVRLVFSAFGYLVVALAELDLLHVSIEHLLVGAGLAGVILGIAAQQSLGNVFASVVLLFAQPFVVGDHVRIRSGALGGIFDGTVSGMSLTYVTLETADGTLKIPNSVMLATAVGPWRPPADPAAPGAPGPSQGTGPTPSPGAGAGPKP